MLKYTQRCLDKSVFLHGKIGHIDLQNHMSSNKNPKNGFIKILYNVADPEE